jgi:hypothetical protein
MKLKTVVLVIGVMVFLLGGYVSSWFFLPQLGLAGPMANMAYFYYGKSHTKSDAVLYIAYYPFYRYEVKANGSSRYGIHWSDRKDPPPPTLDDLIKDGLTDDELKDMGFTDKEVKDARQRH